MTVMPLVCTNTDVWSWTNNYMLVVVVVVVLVDVDCLDGCNCTVHDIVIIALTFAYIFRNKYESYNEMKTSITIPI